MSVRPRGVCGFEIELLERRLLFGFDFTAGLVAHYRLDEGAGLTAGDSSGANNPATLNGGATWTSGHVGGAIALDGSTGYLRASHAVSLGPNRLTLAAWANADTWAGGNRRIMQKGTADNQYRFTAEGGVLKFHLFGVTNGTVFTALPSEDVWHHVAATYDGASVRIYVDGALAAQQAASGNIGFTADALYVGTKRATASPGDFFDGVMDDVRVYNRALPSDEIAALVASTTLPTVSIAATDPNAREGRFTHFRGPIDDFGVPNSGTMRFSRLGQTTEPLVVQFTIGGTSVNGTDYETITTSATIPDGASFIDLDVKPLDDRVIEPTENVIVNLLPDAAYVVGTANNATVVIRDDDALNDSPNAPDITEPLLENQQVSGFDVHMEIGPFSDPDPGQTRLDTDWEIWTVGASPVRVWSNLAATGDADHHTHFGDGKFEGPLAGENKLDGDTDYQLRVRTRDNSGEVPTQYSLWSFRNFHTLPEEPPTAPGWVAQQPGYVIEEIPFTFLPNELNWRLPVSIAFVPESLRGPHPMDPLFYVGELYGTIRTVTNNFTVKTFATSLLNYNPEGPFAGTGENGMGSIAVHPVTGNLFASLLYDHPNDGTSQTFPKIMTFTSNDGGLTAATQTDILLMRDEPMLQSHIISDLSFGPDGKLYAHVGDGFETSTAQNILRFKGKILRLNADGSAPDDNPHYDPADRGNDGRPDAEDYWWARGFRNPFGGAWRDPNPGAGTPAQHFTAENGPSLDRLSMLVRDRNYLWDGSNTSMRNFNIAYSSSGNFENGAPDWDPAPAPIDMAFVQASDDADFSNFPADKHGHAFINVSGSTHAQGPNAFKAIQEWVINPDGTRRVSGAGEPANPRELISYEGAGYSTAAGIAMGPGGLYFTTLYPDVDPNPTALGAKVLRVVYNPARWARLQQHTKANASMKPGAVTQPLVQPPAASDVVHSAPLRGNAPVRDDESKDDDQELEDLSDSTALLS
jgi:glucose/arabinose dehydrogenase